MKFQKPPCKVFWICVLLGILSVFTGAANAADYTVTNIADSGAGSLRAAVTSANSDNVDSYISFDSNFFATLKTIVLASGLGVNNNGTLTITGPAAGVEISGGQACRVFAVATSANATFTGLSIIRGKSDLGAGINNDGNLTVNNCIFSLNISSDFGGGIFNSGVLAVNDCSFSGNTAVTAGGGINSGAYVSNGRTSMTMSGCTLYSNSANDGGALYTRYDSSATVSNCTFRQNSGKNKGGAVYNDGGTYLTNCTFVSNFALSGLPGGGMLGSVFGTLGVTNCLGALNQPDTFGPRYTDNGGNVQAASMDEAGLDTFPKNNGGPTETYALIKKGSAVNAGVNSSASLLYDQRGAYYLRLKGGRIDSGAYESNFEVYLASNNGLTLPVGATKTITSEMLNAVDSIGDPVSYTITAGASHGVVKLNGGATGTFTQADIDAGNLSYTQDGSFFSTDSFSFIATDGKGAILEGTFPITITEAPSLVVTTTADTIATDGFCSLREAINYANSNADDSAITFNIPLAEQTAGAWIINLSSKLATNQATTITGPGANKLTVREGDANKAFAVFEVNANTSLTGLSMTNGSYGVASPGTASLSLTDCIISGNGNGITGYGTAVLTNCMVTGNNGPALVNNSGATATLTNCTLSNGSYGIVNNGTATVTDCTMSNNTYGFLSYGTATATNCTMSGNAEYGFMNVGGGPATLTNCTLSGNKTGVLNTSSSTMTNCTVTGNTETGIVNPGTLTANNSLIVGNPANLSANPISGLNNISTGSAAEAGLSPGGLQDNGGPTETIALLSTSPAVDAGNDALAPAKDQRGIARPQGLHSDIGAYEFKPAAGGDTVAPTVTVTTPANSQAIR